MIFIPKEKGIGVARKRYATEQVGLTKQSNQRGSKLSGGEKQRTVIARALVKDAPIILADEPTGNLDVKSSREIAKLLKEVSKDKLVIVVTHNPEFFVEYATRRVTIFDGGVKEDKVIEKPQNTEGKEIVEEKKDKKKTLKDTLISVDKTFWENKSLREIGAEMDVNFKTVYEIFVRMLSFWTQNARQIDAIVRSGGLYRDKWDRRIGSSTYGEITIENALRESGTVYKNIVSEM